MKTRILLTLLLLVCLVSFGFVYQQTLRQFEYKFEYGPSEKKTNELGSQGWELIAIQSTGPGMGNNVPTYVFKRPKI